MGSVTIRYPMTAPCVSPGAPSACQPVFQKACVFAADYVMHWLQSLLGASTVAFPPEVALRPMASYPVAPASNTAGAAAWWGPGSRVFPCSGLGGPSRPPAGGLGAVLPGVGMLPPESPPSSFFSTRSRERGNRLEVCPSVARPLDS